MHRHMTHPIASPAPAALTLAAAAFLAVTGAQALQAQGYVGNPVISAEILPGWANADGTRTVACDWN